MLTLVVIERFKMRLTNTSLDLKITKFLYSLTKIWRHLKWKIRINSEEFRSVEVSSYFGQTVQV